MGKTEILSIFWTSVLGKGYEEKLSEVINIKDPEDRIIQYLSRMLFIITLEIKKEKDDAVCKNIKLEEQISIRLKETENQSNTIVKSKKETSHSSNKKLTFEDDVQNTDESDDDIVPDTEGQKVGNGNESNNTGRGKRNRNLDSDNTQDCHKKARVEIESENNTECIENKNIKANRSYRSLSRSSPRKKKFDKNDTKKVLAEETQFLDENSFYFDVSKRRKLATQTVSVPETLAMTQYLDAPSENYDNTDFYDAASTLSSVTQIDHIDKVVENPKMNKPGNLLHVKEDALQSLESPLKQKLQTPAEESQKIPSPVLGKAFRVNTPNSHRSSSKKVTSPKKCTPNKTTSPKEPLKQIQNSTPLQAVSPSNKYSPLLFKGNLNSSMNDSDAASPSLLIRPWTNIGNPPQNKNEMENIAELATATQPTEFRVPETFLNKQSRLMRKTKSSFEVSTTKTSKESIFTSKRSSMKQASIGNPGMTVDPPVSPKSRKSYKQSKITPQMFTPKTTDLARLTGGVVNNAMANKEDPLEIAMAESLKTAEAEKMRRKKEEEEINKILEGKIESFDSQKEESKSGSSPSTPKKARRKLKSDENLRRSPRKTQNPVFYTGKEVKPSPDSTTVLKSPQNNRISSKRTAKSSMKEKSKSSTFSAVQKDLNTKGSVKLKQEECSEEELMGLTEVLEAVSPPTEVLEAVSPSPPFKIPQTKPKPKRKPIAENSFDMYSMKMNEPEYAYKNDPVRKRSDRKKLAGISCKECEDWYKDSNITPSQLQRKMNACSRHRTKHIQHTNTPPGFWNADMSSDDEL